MDSGLVVGLLEGPVHQDAEVPGREFDLAAVLEIALRGEPQPQVGLRRGVLLQNDVLGLGAFRTARDGARELPESEVFARFVDGAAAFEVAQQGLVAVGCDALEQQPPDRAAALLRDEDVQRLGGAREGHVQQVDVVDVGVDQLAVVLRREARFGHRLLVPHREAADRFGPVAAGLGPDDVLHRAARLGVRRP